MYKTKCRGYFPEDKKQFSASSMEMIKRATLEVQFLIDHGYDMKKVSQFVGNHYMFSERQRLLIARGVSRAEDIKARSEKELLGNRKVIPEIVHIDGFNTIITMEVALSCSPVFRCFDGTIRDLAELRKAYTIIDKTVQALELLKKHLEMIGVRNAVLYLDRPVSNVGRLKELCYENFEESKVNLQVEIIDSVDRELYYKDGVITSDAIILNKCSTWINLMPRIVEDIADVNLIDIRGL